MDGRTVAGVLCLELQMIGNFREPQDTEHQRKWGLLSEALYNIGSLGKH